MTRIVPDQRSRSRGFTLLELLTVLVIIAILAGALVLNYTDSSVPRTLNTQSERFMLLVELARQKSTLQNEVWGVHVHSDSYGFSSYTSNEWFDHIDPPFSSPTLTEEYSLRVRLLGNTSSASQSGNNVVPDLIIYPSGEVTPFEVMIVHRITSQSRYIFSDGIQRAIVSKEPYRPVIEDKDD